MSQEVHGRMGLGLSSFALFFRARAGAVSISREECAERLRVRGTRWGPKRNGAKKGAI